jgi:glycosyltransferase involved in cell wall biosynthesis
MPLTIIEAFACGTPVITSNLGAMATMIRDGWNGLHFTAGDVAALQQQLEQWNALSVLERFAIGDNAMDTYQRHYTPGKNLDQLLAVYEHAIQQQYKAPAKENVYSN